MELRIAVEFREGNDLEEAWVYRRWLLSLSRSVMKLSPDLKNINIHLVNLFLFFDEFFFKLPAAISA